MSLRVPLRLRALESLVASLHGSPRPLTADERSLLGDIASEMVTEIQEAWPADTGFSAGRWGATISGQRDDYRIELTNDASYVEFVRRAGDPTPLYQSLLPALASRYAPLIPARMRPVIERSEAALTAAGGRGSRERSTALLDLLRAPLRALGAARG